MGQIIQVLNLQKNFQREIKKTGFINRLKSLFHSEYSNFEAVQNINFEVNHGEKVAFLGPNGAGKSTTIKMLTGILVPTSGTIQVLNLNPSTQRDQLVYQIGAVFGQISRLWYHLSPVDTFFLMGKLFEISPDKLKKRIDYLVNIFEIHDIIKITVRKLSLGQRMRCEIVASLINQPQVLFLDEPTIGLDIIAKQKLREIINQINKIEGTTIFLTSHDLQDIENICQRVIIINHGKILYDGNLQQLRKNYLKKKIIKVEFQEECVFQPTDFMDMKLQTPKYIELEIPNDKISLQKTIEIITSKYHVEDISIQNPNIEEIIKEF